MQRDYRHFISSCLNDRLMKSENDYFTKDELKQIDDADDLHISPFRENGKTFMIFCRLNINGSPGAST